MGSEYENLNYEEAKQYFDKHYNVSYVDPSLPVPDNHLLLKHYLCSALIYSFATLLFLFNPFYQNIVNAKYFGINFNAVIPLLFLAYLLIAPICLYIFKPRTVYVSHSISIINYLLRIIKREGLSKNANAGDFLVWLKPDYYQSQAIILFFIKFFFAPQLIAWAFGHLTTSISYYKDLMVANYNLRNNQIFITVLSNPVFLVQYRDIFYSLIVNALFFIDCFVYSIGYCSELTFFRNRIRTVESSVLGLFVCLLCYPPFNSASGAFLAWSHNEDTFNIGLQTSIITWLCYISAVILLVIYVSASVALFTKASNLTNRGTVSIFPYNIVRHPAYISKILLWWLGSVVFIKEFVVAGNFIKLLFYFVTAILWTTLYYLRAVTEERHLSKDPDYRAYVKKVKYRFIPFVI